ncbi:PEP-CTERM sorting domain-containing protein [Methylomagnum sp.]
MNKTLTLTLLAGLTLGAAAPASASFSGAYDIANWDQYTDGYVDTSEVPAYVAIGHHGAGTFGDGTGEGNGLGSIGITIPATGLLSFDWFYQSFDCCGPAYDPFVYWLNWDIFQLTDDGGSSTQPGSVSFVVNAGDVLWLEANGDGDGGNNVQISNFSVPEPGTLALLALGGALGLRRRRA